MSSKHEKVYIFKNLIKHCFLDSLRYNAWDLHKLLALVLQKSFLMLHTGCSSTPTLKLSVTSDPQPPLHTHLGSGSRSRSHSQGGSGCATSLHPSQSCIAPTCRRGWWGWFPGWSRQSAASAACWSLRPSCWLPSETRRRGWWSFFLKLRDERDERD